jgi:hypothetical protein
VSQARAPVQFLPLRQSRGYGAVVNSPEQSFFDSKLLNRKSLLGRLCWKVEITNARNSSVNVEVEIPYELRRNSKNMPKIDGMPAWKTTIVANSQTMLYYALKLERN